MSYPCPRPAPRNDSAHTGLLVAFLKVARSASERALRSSQCPDVLHLVERAHENLAAAHDLIRTDLEWAA